MASGAKAQRVRALEVLRNMRANHSLTASCKLVGMDIRAAKSQLGNAIFKKRRRYHARKTDHLERGMFIYERGRIRTIIVNDPKTASALGHYLNDIKLLLRGKLNFPTFKQRYQTIVIVDVDGKVHKLEVRLDRLTEIELSREDVVFVDIYDY
jgi:hypothetical protein